MDDEQATDLVHRLAAAERWSADAPGVGDGGPGLAGRRSAESEARMVLVRGLLGATGAVALWAGVGAVVAMLGAGVWCGVEWIVARRRVARWADVFRERGV